MQTTFNLLDYLVIIHQQAEQNLGKKGVSFALGDHYPYSSPPLDHCTTTPWQIFIYTWIQPKVSKQHFKSRYVTPTKVTIQHVRHPLMHQGTLVPAAGGGWRLASRGPIRSRCHPPCHQRSDRTDTPPVSWPSRTTLARQSGRCIRKRDNKQAPQGCGYSTLDFARAW